MRLFVIHNQAYNFGYVIAEGIDGAIAQARKSKFLRRSTRPRKVRDITDLCLTEDKSGTLAKLLALGEAHCVKKTAEGEWELE